MQAEVLQRLHALAEHFGLDMDMPLELIRQSGSPVERHEQFHMGTALLLDKVLAELGVEAEAETEAMGEDEHSELG